MSRPDCFSLRALLRSRFSLTGLGQIEWTICVNLLPCFVVVRSHLTDKLFLSSMLTASFQQVRKSVLRSIQKVPLRSFICEDCEMVLISGGSIPSFASVTA